MQTTDPFTFLHFLLTFPYLFFNILLFLRIFAKLLTAQKKSICEYVIARIQIQNKLPKYLRMPRLFLAKLMKQGTEMNVLPCFGLTSCGYAAGDGRSFSPRGF